MATAPLSTDVHFDRVLTDVSIAHVQTNRDKYISSRVFPTIPVKHQSDVYMVYKADDYLRSVAEQRAPGTESEGGGWEYSTDTYRCAVYAVHKDLTAEDKANADEILDLKKDSTEWIADQLELKKDLLFRSVYFQTGAWGRDITGAATGDLDANTVTYWNSPESDPVADVAHIMLSQARKTGARPNKMVMSPDVFVALTLNQSIKGILGANERSIVNEQFLATVFNVEEVIVNWVVENTAPVGQPMATDFVSEGAALLVYAPKTAGTKTLTGGAIFGWKGLLGDKALGGKISTFEIPQYKVERVEGELAFDMKITAPSVGVFLSGLLG